LPIRAEWPHSTTDRLPPAKTALALEAARLGQCSGMTPERYGDGVIVRLPTIVVPLDA
jgi:hypothetical protein